MCAIDAKNCSHSNPLHIASENGHLECVKYLVEKRAELDAKDENNRHGELLQALIVVTISYHQYR